MLYRQKKDTYIRNFDGVGYICSTLTCNDRVVNDSGTFFLEAMSREPQTLEQLVSKILPNFLDANKDELEKDAIEFYDLLIQDGFLVKGVDENELDAQDAGFSYKVNIPKTVCKDFSPAIKRADIDTQEFLSKQFNGKPHLASFQIELTSRCNERCVHCYIPHKYKLYDITEKMYYSVLEQLSEMDVLSISLSGGEPMMHPKFLDFLKAAKKYDFSINILSNLTLLNDEMIKEMKDSKIARVQVSLYSMIPEHHDAITAIRGSFEKTKNSILKLIDNDIPVVVSCPTMKANKDDYSEVLRWCTEHKIECQTDYIIMAQYNHDTSNLVNRLSLDEAGNVMKTIMEQDEYYKQSILADNFIERCKAEQFNPDRTLCGVGISTCCMVANGNVYPCAGWQEMVLGNLEEDSLKNIWDNSPKVKWLRNLKMRDLGNGECCKCDKAAFCAPCLVRNANESSTGNPLEINRHFCATAALNKKIVLEWREKNLKNKNN